jgi:hypothetical protein
MTVGVAPGTTTIHLGLNEPNKQLVLHNPWVSGDVALGAIQTKAKIRWDIIGVIGGGSLIIALAAGLIASAFEASSGRRAT